MKQEDIRDQIKPLTDKLVLVWGLKNLSGKKKQQAINDIEEIQRFVEHLITTALAKQREEILEAINKHLQAKEVAENGKRYLIVDGEKKPFGYPFPDSKAKYAIKEAKRIIEGKQ
jgi:hypothetical protein